MNRGFTIVELVVSVAIFVMMTTLIVAKFGNFNQSTLLTDTAYDIALTIRIAQTYGLSVRNSGVTSAQDFNQPYGIDFDSGTGDYCGGATTNLNAITLFADSSPVGAPDGMCGVSDASVNSYAITRGAKISGLCVGADATACHSSGSVTRLGVSFVRPNPEAVICGANGGSPTCGYAYAEMTIQGTDASTRVIVVRQNGQISVQH